MGKNQQLDSRLPKHKSHWMVESVRHFCRRLLPPPAKTQFCSSNNSHEKFQLRQFPRESISPYLLTPSDVRCTEWIHIVKLPPSAEAASVLQGPTISSCHHKVAHPWDLKFRPHFSGSPAFMSQEEEHFYNTTKFLKFPFYMFITTECIHPKNHEPFPKRKLWGTQKKYINSPTAFIQPHVFYNSSSMDQEQVTEQTGCFTSKSIHSYSWDSLHHLFCWLGIFTTFASPHTYP